jgi:DNA-directed RNA polymerase subunit omega
MNPELAKIALAKVGNPNVLVNIVSRRVRQLNSGGGGLSRPLVSDTGNLGLADIALLELIHEKIGFDLPEAHTLVAEKPKKRRRSAS